MRTRAQPLHILPQILRHNPGLKFLFPIALLIGGSRRVTGEARRSGGCGGRLCKSKLGKIQMGDADHRKTAKKERNEVKDPPRAARSLHPAGLRCAG